MFPYGHVRRYLSTIIFTYRILYFSGISLQEALDIAYDEGDVTDIYIEPPESNVLTDEDSADEDEGGVADNLSARQLLAPAEVLFGNKNRLGMEDNEVVDHCEAISSPCSDTITVATKPIAPKFIQGDLQPPCREFNSGSFSKYSSMSCVEIFELFFSDELLHNIITESANYALFKNSADPQFSIEEMKVFIGILILSGINVLPTKRSYWENSKDMKNEMISDAMRRDRFLQITKYIHFANNHNVDAMDKMYKLRQLTDYLKKKFLEHFVPEPNLAYDESMIRYFGRHGCKQFIRGKPVRFGYKVWCLNAPSGYLINFEIYQGKNPRSNPNYELVFGKPTAPLLQMIEELGDKKSFCYNFFVDNLFTTANLLCTLKANGYGGTGTLRQNRVPPNCPLPPIEQMKKKARGAYSSALEQESGIMYVRWMDNSVVTMASTSFGVAPVKPVDRFSRKDKKKVGIPRPDLVMQYNRNMGGTDQMDNNISW